MSNARTNTKLVARTIVGFSTSFTISNVISSNARPKNGLQKAEIAVGSIACGMIVSDIAAAKTDRFVDAIFDAFDGKTKPTIIVTH